VFSGASHSEPSEKTSILWSDFESLSVTKEFGLDFIRSTWRQHWLWMGHCTVVCGYRHLWKDAKWQKYLSRLVMCMKLQACVLAGVSPSEVLSE
uniref:Uncharacterized protein n=1 Tax=Nothoprocta perdicaria TaxID=30464 RepID=A0A8C6Z9D5_NOTPE